MILYEYPCNERVRAFLRVEHLFDRLFYFTQGSDPLLHQVAVSTLFELLELCERSDIRGMVLQDMERQRVALTALREHPNVAGQRLDSMLQEMQEVVSELAAQGKIGQSLRDNEWLSSLRGRLAIPGGTSQVDIPSYFTWQLKSEHTRRASIEQWTQPFLPLHRALRLILGMLRSAGDVVDHVAHEGNYQEMLSGKSFQLLRVWVAAGEGVFPEMSANKYVIWVRFALQDNENKPLSVSKDIPFKLARCNIG